MSGMHQFCIITFILSIFFFFNHPATTEIYTLSLHDALPILVELTKQNVQTKVVGSGNCGGPIPEILARSAVPGNRSEEHTSELQSHSDLVCRLLLEKKKKTIKKNKQAITKIELKETMI